MKASIVPIFIIHDYPIQNIQLWKIDSIGFQKLSGTKCVKSLMH